jgi:hypothetical protein
MTAKPLSKIRILILRGDITVLLQYCPAIPIPFTIPLKSFLAPDKVNLSGDVNAPNELLLTQLM